MERDPNTLSPKMLQGFAEPKASGEGSSVPCAPVPAVTESPNLYPPAHLQNTQSRASVPWCDPTSVRFPQILALLTLLSGRSCHENCVGGLLWSLWSRWLRDAVPTSEKTSSPTVYKNNSGDFECLCKVFKKTRRCAAMQLKRSRAHLCKALRLLGVAQTAPSFRLWWGPQR